MEITIQFSPKNAARVAQVAQLIGYTPQQVIDAIPAEKLVNKLLKHELKRVKRRAGRKEKAKVKQTQMKGAASNPKARAGKSKEPARPNSDEPVRDSKKRRARRA
jgi:hypothetical protein